MRNTVDLNNPVNWNAPLNQGLMGWWKCLPGLTGGTKFYDLCKRSNATLLSTPIWLNSKYLSGYSSLQFDGADDYATFMFPNIGNGDYAIAGSARPAVITGNHVIFSVGTGTTPLVEIWAGTFAGDGYCWNAYGENYTGGVILHTTLIATQNVWARILLTRVAGTTTLYVNGIAKASHAISNTIPAGAGNIGARTVGSLPWSGNLDNLKLWVGRGLTAREVFIENLVLLSNYSNELNYIRTKTSYYLPPTNKHLILTGSNKFNVWSGQG